MDRIGFFGYPTDFTVHSLFGFGGTQVTPSDHYLFQVREGARAHTVYWDDNRPGAASRRVLQLRDLADMIQRTAEGAPAVAALPPFKPGCA